MCYKHKMYELKWKEGHALRGERHCAETIDFYIDNDVVHIADTKVRMGMEDLMPALRARSGGSASI